MATRANNRTQSPLKVNLKASKKNNRLLKDIVFEKHTAFEPLRKKLQDSYHYTRKFNDYQLITVTPKLFDLKRCFKAYKRQKPEFSYNDLITEALLSSENKTNTLGYIYKYITDKYNYFQEDDNTWKGSVRHNLSLSTKFMKVPMENSQGRRVSQWRLVG